ncbi:hypothetical protein SAMD00019534_064740, partial [Acytostelium subglobosum LB1]|uniref:hypothetical protein n=1 Tax=Acytostelium subglobosum LB1 TaxID=1410327 RepID=UPI0006447C8D
EYRMVKFLSFDLFDSQNLLPSENDDAMEPLDVVPALNDFLVSTKSGTILHYAIGATESTVLNRFTTQNSHIMSLHYVPANDSILTLERDTDASKIYVVRLYQNWRQNQSFEDANNALSSSPMSTGGGAHSHLTSSSPHLSGGHSSGQNSPHKDHTSTLPTVLKIPLPSSAIAINVCPVTSRVVVATEKSVSVWSSVSTGGLFITYFERILDIDAENVRHVSIHEGFVAYATKIDVKILSLNILNVDSDHNRISPSASGNATTDQKNIKMRCVFSTQKEGFLYNISKPGLLASYLYANETLMCQASHCFLYTVTTAGLQTWSLRSCDGADDGSDGHTPCGFGLRTFFGLNKLAVIGDYIVLLSKMTQDQVAEMSGPGGMLRSPSRILSPKKTLNEVKLDKIMWAVYVVHHTPLQSLYGQILEYATKIKEKDEDVYHQLLLEGHFLLQAKLSNQFRSNPNMNDVASMVNHDVERKNFRKLLRKSSSYLGQYFLNSQQDYMRAALWFSTSDTDIELVFNLLSQNTSSHKALSYYLKQVLFNPSSVEFLADKEDLSNKILRHYHSESPHNLAYLILESSVSSYSQELAIELLKNLSEQCDFDMEQRNMNYFALGLLYLDQANCIDESISSLNQIPVDSLISLCLKNPKLLLAPNSNPTALGKILRQTIPWGLLQITVQLVKKKEISPDDAFNILVHSTTTLNGGVLNSTISSYHHQDFDLDSLLLKVYLEWFLNEQCNDHINNLNNMTSMTHSTTSSHNILLDLVPGFTKNLIHLYVLDIHRYRGDDKQLFQSLNIDVAMIVNSTGPKISSSKPNVSQLNNKILTYVGRRTIPPTSPFIHRLTTIKQTINSDEYCNQWILNHLKTYSGIPHWLSKLPPFSLDAQRNPSEKEDPTSKLSSLYYRKLHSLLYSTRVQDFEFMENIETIFSNDVENIMFISLKLACLPLLDRTEDGIKLGVNTQISIMLEYGLHFCKHSDWSVVLEQVLKRYMASEPNQSEAVLQEYERILDHLTNYMDPEAFLQLLPSNGKMDYFLPFIEKSFLNHHAKLLKSKLSDFLLDM